MQLFRKLAGNFLFKIILAFVALTFVLFGVSSFILGSPNSWVAKVGGSKVGYSTFSKILQSDRQAILANNNSDQAQKYVDSAQFKSDVLGRLINKIMVGKLRDDYGVYASKKLILEAVAKDPNFQREGKFSKELFQEFLKKNSANEEKYVTAVSNEVVATMIMQTMSMVSPLDEKMVVESENFRQQKRIADVVTISIHDIKAADQPKEDEIVKFYEANKKEYVSPETRQIAYLTFDKKDFAQDFKVQESELLAEYEKNKEQYIKPETRSFFHVLFDKEEEAKNFLTKFDEATKPEKSNAQLAFVKLAKELKKKDQKQIALNNITKKDLISDLSNNIFTLNLDARSEVLKSPLGFHVFLLTKINASSPVPFNEVKKDIEKSLLSGRQEKVMQEKINQIDDLILSSNSLNEVAKKFNLKNPSAIKINQKGEIENSKEALKIADGESFLQSAFSLNKGQISKILYSKEDDVYYAIKAEEIFAENQKDLKEVRTQVVVDLLKNIRHKAWQDLAVKVGEEIKSHPDQAAQIAAKYNLKFEKNREFPRIYYIEYQGQKIPYQNKFLDELFAVNVGSATSALPSNAQEFVVGIARQIKSVNFDPASINAAKGAEVEKFRNEIMQEFNNYLGKKHEVKVNEKILKEDKEDKKD